MNQDDERIRKQFVKSALSSCRHFNGVQHEKCEAGIAYEHADKTLAMPCLPAHINGRAAWPCASFEIMSQADAEKEADERIVTMNRGMEVRRAAHADAKARGLGKGHGGFGSLPCPGCGRGTLQYSVASYNGHMHGRCSTPGCASWME